MIDIHSHIIWGADDGPETFEESREMLLAAAAAGTAGIVATPHASLHFAFDFERNAKVIEQLRAAAPELRLYSGCELLLTFENIQSALENPARYTIAGGPYLLVEFSQLHPAGQLESIFGTFLERGIRPVIAHPERNPGLRGRRAEIAEWLNMGCLLQITGSSLTGNFGGAAKAFGWDLLEAVEGRVVASDGHNLSGRSPRLDGARAAIEERLGREAAETLLERHPAAIVAGAPLAAPATKRKWYQRWR
jgi:protein-tyrosine phosphatase